MTAQILPDKGFYTSTEAARLLGVSSTTLRRWEEEGRITPLRTIGGDRRYSQKDVQGILTSFRQDNDQRREPVIQTAEPPENPPPLIPIRQMENYRPEENGGKNVRKAVILLLLLLAFGYLFTEVLPPLTRIRLERAFTGGPANPIVDVNDVAEYQTKESGEIRLGFKLPVDIEVLFAKSLNVAEDAVLNAGRFLGTVFFGKTDRYYVTPLGEASFDQVTSNTGQVTSLRVTNLTVTGESEGVGGGASSWTDLTNRPIVLSSLNSVVNNAGNIDLTAGANITITPNDAANTIALAVSQGAGSGLDADLLDGQSGAYYLDFPGFTTLLTDYGFTDNSANWDTAYGWGDHSLIGYLTDITGESVGDLSDVTITLAEAGDYFRYSGAAWVDVGISQILTDLLAVDGASSNLDADLLDGQEGSYYLDLDNQTGSCADCLTTAEIDESTFTGLDSTNIDDIYLFSNGDNGSGTYVFEDDVTLGLTSADTLTVNALIGSSLLPATDDQYDLGSPTARWQDLYLGPSSLNIYNTIGADAEYFTIGYDATPTITFSSLADGIGTARNFNFAGGRVGIGTDSPESRLHLFDGSAGTVTPDASFSNLVIENSATAGISIITPATSEGGILFGNPTDNDEGRIIHNPSTNTLYFYTAGVERLRIDDGIAMFNANLTNTDFNVKGDNSSDLFYIDAGNDSIGIGTSVPASDLEIFNTNPEFRLTNSGSSEYTRVNRTEATNLASWLNRVSQPGVDPYALEFDGDDEVQVNDNATIRLVGGDFTVRAWVYLNSAAASTSRIIVEKIGDAYARDWNVGIDASRHLTFKHQGDTGGSYASTGTVPLTTWTHVQVSVDQVNSLVYFAIGGTVESTAFTSSFQPESQYDGPLMIGKDSGEFPAQEDFDGRIDELELSDTVRNTGNFTPQTTKLSPDGNTQALWHFDEGTGTNAADSSGNGNSGTLQADPNDPAWITGHVTDPGSTVEATVWSSQNGVAANEGGIQKFGDPSGGTWIQGQTQRFYIGGTEEMRLDASGYLGIGTTSPSERLEVSGNIQLTSVNDQLKFADDGYITATADNYIQLQSGGTTEFKIADRVPYIVQYTDTFNYANFNIQKTGIASSGTQYPSYDLIVQGSGWDTDAASAVDLTGRMRLVTGSGATGEVPYRIGVFDDTPTEWAAFDLLNQRVGIGTTAPLAKLHLAREDSSTNTQIELGRFDRTTSGTAAANIGQYLSFYNETDDGTLMQSGRLQFDSHIVSNGPENNESTNNASRFRLYIERQKWDDFTPAFGAYVTGGDRFLCMNGVDSDTLSNWDCFGMTIGSANALTLNFDGNVRLTMGYDASGTQAYIFSTNSADDLLLKTLGSQPISFDTSDDGTDVYIASGGNVGIGTVNPQGKLTVGDLTAGTAEPTYNGFIQIQGGSDITAADNGLEFKASPSGNGYGWLVTSPDRSAGNVPLSFAYRNNSAAWTELVTMRSDTGNVGIGDTTPDGKLDVEATGAVTATKYGISLSNLVTNADTDSIYKVGAYITSTGTFTGGGGGLTANWGLYVDAVSGADLNYGAYFAGKVGMGTPAPNGLLSVVENGGTGGAIRLVNTRNTDGTSNVTLRLGTGTASTGTSARFVTFYAAATTDDDGTGVGRIRLNNGNVAYETGGADYAEYMDVSETVSQGDIISLPSSKGRKALPDERPVGVVSDTAGFVGNAKGDKPGPSQAVVGFAGQIMTKVSAVNGPIGAGDPIAASLVAGVGAKAVRAGSIVGTALESYSGEAVGKIKVFVNPGWYDPGVLVDSGGGVSQTNSDGTTAAIASPTVEAQEGIFEKITATILGTFEKLIAKTAEIASAFIRNLTVERLAVQGEMVGQAVIPVGATSVSVEYPDLTESSKVFFTLDRAVAAGVEKTAGEGFKFVLSAPADLPVTIDYWIVEQDSP